MLFWEVEIVDSELEKLDGRVDIRELDGFSAKFLIVVGNFEPDAAN